ncbi:MAG: hypothetical protein U0263_24820 [Polyangiaceae bacterium]
MRRALLLCAAIACSVSSEQKSFRGPSDEEFRRVSDVLVARCGALDCHGHPQRNFRVYGRTGMRLSSSNVPGGAFTTVDEHEANYASVLGLEPELLERVFEDGGRDPERLTLIRKGRNSESHTGGHAFDSGGDRCVISWLEGQIDAKTCFASSTYPQPPGFLTPAGGTGGGGTGGATGGGGAGGSGGTTGGSGGTTGGSGGSLGGTGGSVSGGTGGVAGCGASGPVCPPDFWPPNHSVHDGTCVPPNPTPADHSAYVATECLSCHSTGGAAGPGKEFLLAGMIWEWGGKKGASKIEVALRDANVFLYTCTDANGFYSIPLAGSTAPDWLAVETRMRSELGEKIMPSDKEHKATCNSDKCHGDPKHQLWAP